MHRIEFIPVLGYRDIVFVTLTACTFERHINCACTHALDFCPPMLALHLMFGSGRSKCRADRGLNVLFSVASQHLLKLTARMRYCSCLFSISMLCAALRLPALGLEYYQQVSLFALKCTVALCELVHCDP